MSVFKLCDVTIVTHIMLKISLITVTYNAEEFIRQCLLSVSGQTYRNMEHIIVDGNSTDRTISLVNRYKSPSTIVVSEADNGIYDAMNKGIALATGDVIGILNADDFFPDPQVLEKIAAGFGEDTTQIVYGNLWYIDRRFPHRVMRKWKSGACTKKLLNWGWMPAHPTFYVRRELFQTLGAYRLQFKTAADYELMLRFLHVHHQQSRYIDELIVVMRTGGTSNKSYLNILLANWRSFQAMQANGLRWSILSLLCKPLRKLPQYFCSPEYYLTAATVSPVPPADLSAPPVASVTA